MKKDICDCGANCNCNHGGKILTVFAVVVLVGILLVSAFNAGTVSNNRVVVTNDSAPNIKTLSVSGSVTKMVTPDKVDIVLSVETLDKLASKSQSNNALIAEAVRKALSDAGVNNSDIKTISYSVYEDFEWNGVLEKSVSVGYRTSNQIQVTLTDITKAGKVVDAAVGAGANRVSSIAFGLSDAKELEVRKTALADASATAKTKANSIASGLGITIGKVYSISESSYGYTPNYKEYDVMASSAEGAAPKTPISAGDVEVNATVSVQFEIN